MCGPFLCLTFSVRFIIYRTRQCSPEVYIILTLCPSTDKVSATKALTCKDSSFVVALNKALHLARRFQLCWTLEGLRDTTSETTPGSSPFLPLIQRDSWPYSFHQVDLSSFSNHCLDPLGFKSMYCCLIELLQFMEPLFSCELP